MRQISSTPAMCAAASTSGLTLPLGVGVTDDQPARRPGDLGGIAFISSDEGIGRPAARDVEPGGIDRAPLAPSRTPARRHSRGLRKLRLVVGADALRGEFERGAQLGLEIVVGLRGSLEARCANCSSGQRVAVEALGQLGERRIAAVAHVLEDQRDVARDVVLASRGGRARGGGRLARSRDRRCSGAASGAACPRRRARGSARPARPHARRS
jgi:hypothetical protein